ncbi:glycosyltransferase family 2 protein [Pseudomonas taiwanensis]|uniref:glycosyltransferase family 2 protein n=1 Tax=Pseudomonas taiwanensis TaxID=470150 RepID=UPI0015BADE37|nr:glycosyltransferase family 2 protein [Pseudomonas taiwanensis]NWL76808.1 glycosyltransferase family 2 protein [Pseudomonas taiwanensis]
MKPDISGHLDNHNQDHSGTPVKIGVLVVCWHNFDLLDKCLLALSGQSIDIHRTVVIDNSSDHSPLELNAPRPANTLYIKLDENVGFAKANNIGIEHLRDCTWVALINPDAFLASNCLAELLQATVDHPEASSFAAVTLNESNPELLDGAGDAYHISGLCWRHGYGRAANSCSLLDTEIFSPCAAVALYRREVYEALGGMDEDYFCYCEDVDLGFRMRLAGHKSRLIPSAQALHVGAASTGGQHSDFALYHGHRNLVWTFVKNMPASLFWLFLPVHLFMNLATLLIYTARGKGLVLFRAKRDALMGLPAAWRKRQKIQANRSVSSREILRVLDISPFIDRKPEPLKQPSEQKAPRPWASNSMDRCSKSSREKNPG